MIKRERENTVAKTNGNRTESDLTNRTQLKILMYVFKRIRKELKQNNFLHIYTVSLYRIIRPHEYMSHNILRIYGHSWHRCFVFIFVLYTLNTLHEVFEMFVVLLHFQFVSYVNLRLLKREIILYVEKPTLGTCTPHIYISRLPTIPNPKTKMNHERSE